MLPASSGGTGGAAADAAARATAITESIQRRIGHQLPPELKDKLAELPANHGSDWAAPRQERGFLAFQRATTRACTPPALRRVGSAPVCRNVEAVGHLESQLGSKRSAPPRIRPCQGDWIGGTHPDDVALHAGTDYARGPRVARRMTSPHVFGQDKEPSKDVPPFLADGSPGAICAGNGVDRDSGAGTNTCPAANVDAERGEPFDEQSPIKGAVTCRVGIFVNLATIISGASTRRGGEQTIADDTTPGRRAEGAASA